MEISEVEKMCTRVKEQTGSNVPPRVQELIHQILDEVENNPDPIWEFSGQFPAEGILKDIAHKGLTVFELYLLGLANREEYRDKISYFAVLHGLSGVLDAICPFKKRRGD